MQKRPIGANMYVNDGEWIFPFLFVVLMMFFGDFAWALGVLMVAYTIVMVHALQECKRNLPKKQLGKWRLYALGTAIVTLLFTPYFLPIFVCIAYATIISRLKRGVTLKKVSDRYFDQRLLTYKRMSMIVIAASCIYAGKTILIFDDIEQVQAEQERQQSVPPVEG